jgi:3-hydroxyisobutyrate dehydrogenase
MKISFIGTGVMGAEISKHLINAGHSLTIFNRSKSARVEELISLGAKWADTPAEAAKDADLIFTMVGFPTDVKEVWLGENGLLKTAKENTIAIDLTTSSPVLAQELFDAGEKIGVSVGDAPVSGGDIGAKNGKLSIMFGGSKDIFENLQPVLSLFGAQIVYAGEAGMGQHMKMSNQLGIAATILGMSESLAYAKAAGLNIEEATKVWANGAAGSWSVSNYVPRIENGDFTAGFYVKHLIKDLGIALDSAHELGLDFLPGTKLAKELYEKLASEGFENDGVQALVKLWPAYRGE